MKLINYALIIVIGLAISTPEIALAINEYYFEPEEYTIYSTVIESWYRKDHGKKLLIRDYTGLYRGRETMETELKYVQQMMPALNDEAINDFKTKNLNAYSLKSFINPRVEYKLITQKEIDYIFDHNPNWETYYNQHPDSGGILTLSRVGFNRRKNQALLHVANQWNLATGAGVYILLNRQRDGSWQIVDQERLWRSWYSDKPGY